MDKEPKITLPSDEIIKGKLEKKLEEYKKRVEEIKFQNPCTYPALIQSTTSAYKAEIVERLLKEGHVDTWQLSKELNEKHNYFDVRNFENAAAVISDYCKTGGKNVRGGTGF